MKKLKRNLIVAPLILLSGLLFACSNPEGNSASLFETAQFEEQQNNFEHAKKLYEEIIRDTPESSLVPKAQARLKALVDQ